MWTALIIFGAASVLMFGETKIENSSVFAPQAAAVPGTIAEREAIRSRAEHTEVYPLALFAILGMMLFPASNDLIMMFVALEILSLPLYLLCGLARRAGCCRRRLRSSTSCWEPLVSLLHLRRRSALWLFRLLYLVGDRRCHP